MEGRRDKLESIKKTRIPGDKLKATPVTCSNHNNAGGLQKKLTFFAARLDALLVQDLEKLRKKIQWKVENLQF